MVNDKRFVRIYTQGMLECMEIWVDCVTGVNYLFHSAGQTGGMTPLLNRDGTPVISALPIKTDD